MHLHGTVGPAATSIAGIAERAGVTRLTVYRHFADDAALFEACSAHWLSRQTLPDPTLWEQISDPENRLRTGLVDLYRFFRAGSDMLYHIYRDIDVIPEARRRAIQARDTHFGDVLAEPFSGTPARRRRIRAIVGHAASFWTWWSLCREHDMSDRDAIDAMTRAAQISQ